MSTLILCAIFWIPISILIMCGIVALGKRPGYRRRHEDEQREGVERRCRMREECVFKKMCRSADQCVYLKMVDMSNVNTETKQKEH